METAAKKGLNPSLWLVVAALLWSMIGVLTKYIPWSGMTCAILRGAITFVVVSLAFRRRVWRIRFNWQKLLCGVCYFAQGMLLIVSMKFTTAANATVLQNTSPLYIMLLNALLLRRFPSRADVATCAALLFGVTLAFAGSLAGSGALGNTLALISALFYAGVFYLSKTAEVDDPIEPVLIGNALYVLLLPLCLLDLPLLRAGTAADWLAQIALGVFCSAGAWMAFTRGIRSTPALTANFITMIEPVASAMIAFWLIGETPTALSIIGCVIVIGALLLHSVWEARRAAASR